MTDVGALFPEENIEIIENMFKVEKEVTDGKQSLEFAEKVLEEKIKKFDEKHGEPI